MPDPSPGLNPSPNSYSTLTLTKPYPNPPPQVLGESCGHLTAAKLLLLTFLCCYYNKNLWYMDMGPV